MHFLTINATPADIYQCLTTPAGIHRWWTSDADLEQQIGGHGEFRFYDGAKVSKIEIVDLSPPTKVEWKVIDSFRPEWVGTTIRFEINETEDGAELRFRHSGFPHANDDYAVCTTGWGIYLGRLQRIVEAGISKGPTA